MNNNQFKHMYSALEGDETDKDYLANVAMSAMAGIDIQNETVDNRKNNFQSEFYREDGNEAYKVGSFQKALVLYNKALAYAPNKSLSLKLAYSNRSAVLFSVQQYKACEQDCVTALAINCATPSNVTEKLEKRTLQAKQHQVFQNHVLDDQKDKTYFRNYYDDYFKLKSRHSDIPCASADIDVVFQSGIPKVIAKRDIPVGTLVAIEKAFITTAGSDADEYLSCYYCRKLDFNLFPCAGCVVALFCSKKCEDLSMKEYHSIECEIIGRISNICPANRWVVPAIIKLRNMCSSWEEFISISYKGYNEDKLGINEIYDSSKPSSLMSFKNKNDRHFIHGLVFNCSILCALFLKAFQTMHSFLPQDWEDRQLAVKAMARIIMHWRLNVPITNLALITNVVTKNSINSHRQYHMGMFTFTGKLKHSCIPNLQLVTVNNSMALFTLEKIETGSELTVSHIIHWTDTDKITNIEDLSYFRKRLLYTTLDIICLCLICTKTPKERSRLDKDKISVSQKQAARDLLTLDQCRSFGIPPKKCFEQIYKTLALLNNVKFSDEYKNVFRTLVQFQMYVLSNKLQNVMLSEDY